MKSIVLKSILLVALCCSLFSGCFIQVIMFGTVENNTVYDADEPIVEGNTASANTDMGAL